MKNQLIQLVKENLELVKKSKINFEMGLVKETGGRLNISSYEIQGEIQNIRNMFLKCNTPEEVVDFICEKDFSDSYTDEYFDDLYENINDLIVSNY